MKPLRPAVPRAPQDVIDAFVEYVPTFWVSVKQVEVKLPPHLRDCYVGRRLSGLLIHHRKVFETRSNMRGWECRIREDATHPRKGVANSQFPLPPTPTPKSTPLPVTADAPATQPATPSLDKTVLQAPPAAGLPTHTTLFDAVCQCLGDGHEFVELTDLESRISSDLRSSDPRYTAVGGLAAYVDGYCEAFQLKGGKVRHRPPDVAPNALDEFDQQTSPAADIFQVVFAVVPSDKTEWVETSSLYAQLTPQQKAAVKERFESFPRFPPLTRKVRPSLAGQPESEALWPK